MVRILTMSLFSTPLAEMAKCAAMVPSSVDTSGTPGLISSLLGRSTAKLPAKPSPGARGGASPSAIAGRQLSGASPSVTMPGGAAPFPLAPSGAPTIPAEIPRAKIVNEGPDAGMLEQFRKGTGTAYNPSSWLDRNKMMQLRRGNAQWANNRGARLAGRTKLAGWTPLSVIVDEMDKSAYAQLARGAWGAARAAAPHMSMAWSAFREPMLDAGRAFGATMAQRSAANAGRFRGAMNTHLPGFLPGMGQAADGIMGMGRGLGQFARSHPVMAAGAGGMAMYPFMRAVGGPTPSQAMPSGANQPGVPRPQMPQPQPFNPQSYFPKQAGFSVKPMLSAAKGMVGKVFARGGTPAAGGAPGILASTRKAVGNGLDRANQGILSAGDKVTELTRAHPVAALTGVGLLGQGTGYMKGRSSGMEDGRTKGMEEGLGSGLDQGFTLGQTAAAEDIQSRLPKDDILSRLRSLFTGYQAPAPGAPAQLPGDSRDQLIRTMMAKAQSPNA